MTFFIADPLPEESKGVQARFASMNSFNLSTASENYDDFDSDAA